MNDGDKSPRRHLLIFQIGSLYYKIHRECDIIFREKEFPLEMDQLPVLLALYYTYPEGTSQQELGHRLQRDKASINRTVAFLSKKDIVKVIQDVTDKRKTRIELTATGKKLSAQADTILEKFNGFLASTLTEEERGRLNDLLPKLITTLDSL